MKKVFIYSLEVNGIPFYVGKTNNIKNRYKCHLKEANEKRINIYKNFPLRFEIKILDNVDESNWEFWEKYYIALIRSWGFKLLNISIGGRFIKKYPNSKNKSKSKISIYCKCDTCNKMFDVTNKIIKRYCSRSCRDKANYKNKK